MSLIKIISKSKIVGKLKTLNDSGSENNGGSSPEFTFTSAVVFAGSGTQGYLNGQGTASQFNFPYGTTVDQSGNVYVGCPNNRAIRKITPSGAVTTLVQGDSVIGEPNGLAVDSDGNIYSARASGHRIHKITPSGVVTTLAGSGVQGSADGTGVAASFHGPYGVAVDSSGNVYVADRDNNKIRKITPSGVVTTLAGSGAAGSADGTGVAASFCFPNGVAVDSSGNVYVADAGNNKIRKITPSGVVTTLAGSGVQGSADGTGTAASFYSPQGITADGSGNVYVADTMNSKIRKITPSGVVTTLLPTWPFGGPVSLGISSNGIMYIANTGNHKIIRVSG